MEKFLKLTTPRAQLYGSFLAVFVVVLCGLLSVTMLGDTLELARTDAGLSRSRNWIRSVVNDPLDAYAAADLVEKSDAVRFGAPGRVSIYTARRDGARLATAIKWVEPAGYNGSIELALAVDLAGKVIGISVLSHNETPGFGDVIGEADSTWMATFLGRSLHRPESTRWRLRGDKGDIDGISGATITADAVVNGVFKVLSYLEHSGLTNVKEQR